MTRLAALALSAAILSGGPPAMAAEPAARSIRRSDVIFMYDNPDRYEAYGCTALGWGGHANAQRIELAHARGVRAYACSVGFLTEFARAIDFSPDFLDAACRDFDGKPYLVPWLWDHKHKGQPAYWWCTNSPLYRRYLETRLEETMAAKPDGLHIDDYRGTSGAVTWLAGGFCRHCMAAFRDYLAARVPKQKLADLGIADLVHFDYREFLVARGVTMEQYKKQRASLPLADEFYTFQVMANTDYVAAYRKRGEDLRGQPLTLSVNSELGSPHALVVAPHLSHFCCEVDQQAATRKPPTHPVAVYKLGDALDRPIAATASGWDWAFVAEHKLPGLVRTWVALSYAFGHNLMAPHRQWCYTKEKGTHWYDGPTEEYAWLYQFVRRNARLLDGYDAVAPVAVVYCNAAARKGKGKIEPICAELAGMNVPFTVVAAGDDWLPHRLDARRLADFRAVVVPDGADLLDAEQKQLLDRADAAGRLVKWPDKKHLAELLPTPVAVEGSNDVWVVPRAIPGTPTAPAAIHLLNRAYDATKDSMVPQRDFTVRLRRDLFGGRRFTTATLHSPKAEPVAIQASVEADHVTLRVPALDLWAIVELSEEGQPK